MFTEHYDGKWLTVELVPGFIEADAARLFGSPSVRRTRVHTEVAAGAYENGDWDDYSLTKEQAFAAFCFEVGREYQRSRKLRQRIAQSCKEGWSEVKKE